MSSTHVITYERGTSYVKQAGSNATALVGQLYVGGTLVCDTFERLNGYVSMPAGTYHRSSMYVDAKRGEVLNPSLLSSSGENHEYGGKFRKELDRLMKIQNPTPADKQAIADTNKKLARMGQYANILFHAGEVPSDFEGCIGCGWIESNRLTFAKEAMYYIYTLVGGTLTPAPEVTLKVVGKIPSAAELTVHAG